MFQVQKKNAHIRGSNMQLRGFFKTRRLLFWLFITNIDDSCRIMLK